MYKSPIDVFISDIQNQITKQTDDKIYEAVVSVGINVDKNELIRALQYDRQQYEEGFRTGKIAAMNELIRCRECKHCTVMAEGMVCECALPTKRMEDYYLHGSTILARVDPDAFCSRAERRDAE